MPEQFLSPLFLNIPYAQLQCEICMQSPILTEIRDQYKRHILELCKKSNGASQARVLAILSSTTCEELASNLIFNQSEKSDLRFDSYYREKHEMLKRKFVDRLKAKLREFGKELQFLVCTEELTDFGRCDLTIIDGNRLKIQSRNGRSLYIELKASLGLDLAQIERYLLNGEPLLIVRVITGQVILFLPDEVSEFLEESLRDLTCKTERILQGQPFLVPGHECLRCSMRNCGHNKLKPQRRRLVSMSPMEFEEDFKTFTRNIYPTINIATQTVLRELGIV